MTPEMYASYETRQAIWVARYRGRRRWSRIKTREIVNAEKALERLEAAL